MLNEVKHLFCISIVSDACNRIKNLLTPKPLSSLMRNEGSKKVPSLPLRERGDIGESRFSFSLPSSRQSGDCPLARTKS